MYVMFNFKHSVEPWLQTGRHSAVRFDLWERLCMSLLQVPVLYIVEYVILIL